MVKTKYITRDLEKTIYKYIDSKEIIAIVGVRQCGKTTLMKKIAEDLKNAGKTINFISFDDTGIMGLFQDDINSFIKLHIKSYDYLFIDEIQYAMESGKKLKFTLLIMDSETSVLITFPNHFHKQERCLNNLSYLNSLKMI